jgi:hypothetical protein
VKEDGRISRNTRSASTASRWACLHACFFFSVCGCDVAVAQWQLCGGKTAIFERRNCCRFRSQSMENTRILDDLLIAPGLRAASLLFLTVCSDISDCSLAAILPPLSWPGLLLFTLLSFLCCSLYLPVAVILFLCCLCAQTLYLQTASIPIGEFSCYQGYTVLSF